MNYHCLQIFAAVTDTSRTFEEKDTYHLFLAKSHKETKNKLSRKHNGFNRKYIL